MNDAVKKIVRIFLEEGSITGLRHADIQPSPIQAIACPRMKIKLLDSWEESHRPGVYFLYGDDTETGELSVYIGKSANVRDRLRDHLANKEFWREVILFTDQGDASLTTAHVEYLEAQIVQMARDAKRHPVTNDQTPKLPMLPRGEQEIMGYYVEDIRILLGVLGRETLEPLPAPSDAQKSAQANEPSSLVFTLSSKGIEAKGFQSDEGFVVLEGSDFVKEGKEYLKDKKRKHIRLRREELVDKGIVGPVQESNNLRFRENHPFNGPGQAAEVILGSSERGKQLWMTEDGKKSFADVEAAEAAGESQT